jgi:mono/diheme cytochrome c family protein
MRVVATGGLALVWLALVSAQSGPQSAPASQRPAARAGQAAGAPSTTQAPAARPQPAVPTSATNVAAQRALLDKYCVTCHNERTKTADLQLDQLDLSHLAEHREIAEKVVRKMRAGLMPPTNMPRPDPATFEGLIRWMETELDRGDHAHLPAPGLHRLNRVEYANAIRDLLALEVDATKFLPVDDSTKGFDNIAGALTMSPALMEAYLSAAGKISRLAIGTVDGPTQWVWDVPADTAQTSRGCRSALAVASASSTRFQPTASTRSTSRE